MNYMLICESYELYANITNMLKIYDKTVEIVA